jgi:hypothetical protein
VRAVASAMCSLHPLILGVFGIVGNLLALGFHLTLAIRQLDTSFFGVYQTLSMLKIRNDYGLHARSGSGVSVSPESVETTDPV